jgi:predicted nucleic acid-binding protein
MSHLAIATPGVVYDVNVIVTAVASGNSPFRSWPSPPPTSGNPSADCVGIAADAAEFSLWLSDHILDNTLRVLSELFKWDTSTAQSFADVLSDIGAHSGGGVLENVPRTVHDCPDYEDNLILDLASEVGAILIVSNDTGLLAMSPWRGTPILTPASFASKVDAMRRHARRRRR